MTSTSHEHRKKKKGLILSLKRKAKDNPGSNVPVSLNSVLLWYRRQNYFSYTSLSPKIPYVVRISKDVATYRETVGYTNRTIEKV